MRPCTRRVLAPSLVLAAAALGACGGDKSPTPPAQCTIAAVSSARASIQPLRPGPYHALFVEAGREFGVPAALLESLGWSETRWQMVEGREEFEGMPAAFGVMALRGRALERGAALAGVSAQQARSDARANIRAGAALLAAYGRETGAAAAAPESWAAATELYSGIEAADARLQYSTAVLAGAGVARPLPLAYAAADPCTPKPPTPPPAVSPDFAGAIWRPAPAGNFGLRTIPPGGAIHMIIIHTCEGNYSGCWAWLQNPQSGVSAHYVVSEDGGEVTQLVKEAGRAFQIAATYDCTLNYNHDCTDGLYNKVQANHFTIGIEHGGYADKTDWPVSMYETSARLVCDITKRQDIPRDWRHIVGHGQLQPANRTDPGAKWPWTMYMGMIQRDCGELVADDDNARNDTAFVKVQVPASWYRATDTNGFYAFSYRWADSGAAADEPMVFSFYVAQAGARTVEAWWTAGSNRSTSARYIVVSAAGDTLGSASANQTTNGGDWQRLGQWTFPVGWNRVLLSRVGPAGKVVVGDAVRLR